MQSEEQTGLETPIKEKETKYTKSGAKEKALDLYENGKTPVEIYRLLKEEGYEVSEEGIRQSLINNSKIKRNVTSDIQMAKKFSQMIMDYETELKSMLDEIKEVKEMAKNEKEYNAYSALVGRLLQGIELFSKIAGDFKENKVDINIILGEIDSRIRASKGLFEESIDVNALVIEEDENVRRKKDSDSRKS